MTNEDMFQKIVLIHYARLLGDPEFTYKNMYTPESAMQQAIEIARGVMKVYEEVSQNG